MYSTHYLHIKGSSICDNLKQMLSVGPIIIYLFVRIIKEPGQKGKITLFSLLATIIQRLSNQGNNNPNQE